MKQAILYLRYTSSELAKEHAQNHYDFAEKYCAENGIEIFRVFDEISINPTSERYYLDKALKVSKYHSEDIRFFLIMECSQISSNYLEFKEIQEELKSYEIYILSIFADSTVFTEDLFEN